MIENSTQTELYQVTEKAAAFDRLAAVLGAAAHWEGAADLLDAIAQEIDETNEKLGDKIEVGSTNHTQEWRRRADELGVYYNPDPGT
jgi:hypothetical protein